MSPRILALLFACLITSAAPQAQGHGGTTQSLAWEACDDLTQGALCDYENDHHDVYRGTCRTIQERLICVRNKPIEYAKIEHGEAHTHGGEIQAPEERMSWASIPFGVALLGVGILGIGWSRSRKERREDGVEGE